MKNIARIALFGAVLAIVSVVAGGARIARADNDCTINTFYASPSTISVGQSATLVWTTSGCTYATIKGGAFTGNDYLQANGSTITETLYGSTTYAIYAFSGDISTSKTLTVYVDGGPYSYSYQCPNDGDTFGCSSPYDENNGLTSMMATTTLATNIGSTTARLNGIITNAPQPFVSYFEYGTTPELGSQTTYQNESPTATYSYYDTVYVSPNTTYYYRAVGIVGDTIVRGSISSFTTPTSSSTQIIYVGGSSNDNASDTNTADTVPANPSAVTLTITNPGDDITVGDTVEDTVTYTNGTNKMLTSATISVVLPQGFVLKQTTQGLMVSATTVNAFIGAIAPGQTGSIFIQAVVGPSTATNVPLVTNGTLAYTLPGNLHDSVVGYVINHASTENVIAGFALGSGFFPATIWGWFFTTIIILIIVLIARRIAREKEQAAHGHGGHGDAHGGGHSAPKH